MQNLKRIAVPAVLGAGALASSYSMADGVDFTSLTSAAVFTTVGVAILAVAAAKVVPLITAWGAAQVMSFIRRG